MPVVGGGHGNAGVDAPHIRGDEVGGAVSCLGVSIVVGMGYDVYFG